jgi:hypothetical protein
VFCQVNKADEITLSDGIECYQQKVGQSNGVLHTQIGFNSSHIRVLIVPTTVGGDFGKESTIEV